MKKIVLTGGGTAGHVIPHIALLPEFINKDWDILYLGSNGIEQKLMHSKNVRFKPILVGKLRRYFSVQNFFDLFKVTIGLVQSIFILASFRPNVIFSKGGFVSVPVAVAAWILRIPVITHESDLSPGLATRIILPFASKVLYSFPETEKYLPKGKSVYCGTPVRKDLIQGCRQKGLEFCGFFDDESVPVLLVMGGSLGAARVNVALRECLPELVKTYQVIHLTGAGKEIDYRSPRYKAFAYLDSELPDIFACSDLIVSRAGANSIFELVSLNKAMLLIPLTIGSRGDQVLNAKSFATRGWAHVLNEDELAPQSLSKAIFQLHLDSKKIRKAQREKKIAADAATKITLEIEQAMT